VIQDRFLASPLLFLGHGLAAADVESLARLAHKGRPGSWTVVLGNDEDKDLPAAVRGRRRRRARRALREQPARVSSARGLWLALMIVLPSPASAATEKGDTMTPGRRTSEPTRSQGSTAYDTRPGAA
jgi:hypothetical protein